MVKETHKCWTVGTSMSHEYDLSKGSPHSLNYELTFETNEFHVPSQGHSILGLPCLIKLTGTIIHVRSLSDKFQYKLEEEYHKQFGRLKSKAATFCNVEVKFDASGKLTTHVQETAKHCQCHNSMHVLPVVLPWSFLPQSSIVRSSSFQHFLQVRDW